MKRKVLFYLLFGVFLTGALGVGLLLPRVLVEGKKRAVTDTVTVIPALALPRTYTLGAASLHTALDLLYLGEKEDASVLRADYLAPKFKEDDTRPRLVQELQALGSEGFLLDGDAVCLENPYEFAAQYAKNENVRADYSRFLLASQNGYVYVTAEAFDGTILGVSQRYAPSQHQKGSARQLADAFAKYLGLQTPAPLSAREEGYYSVKEYLCEKEELVIAVRMGEYQMDVSAYPYRYYPVNWIEEAHSSVDGTQAPMTEEPVGEAKLPRIRREGFVCPEFTFYSEDGVPFSPADRSYVTGEGESVTVSVQEKAEESIRILYDMFGYVPASCAVMVTDYGFYFSHTRFALYSTLPEDSDIFFETDINIKTGEIKGIQLNYDKGYPPNGNEIAQPEAIGMMSLEEAALYYYENSSFGDRSPIVRTGIEIWNEREPVVKLFLADGRFYEVNFEGELPIPTRMWGIYEKGYTH